MTRTQDIAFCSGLTVATISLGLLVLAMLLCVPALATAACAGLLVGFGLALLVALVVTWQDAMEDRHGQ